MLSIHTEFHPIWSSRRDAVASPDLEIIDGIYCIFIAFKLIGWHKIESERGRSFGNAFVKSDKNA